MKPIEIDEQFVKNWIERASWICEVCGCTEDRGCVGGCYWEEKNLCSVCFEQRRDLTPDLIRVMENTREQINKLFQDAVCWTGDTYNFGWSGIEKHLSTILESIDSIENIIKSNCTENKE